MGVVFCCWSDGPCKSGVGGDCGCGCGDGSGHDGGGKVEFQFYLVLLISSQ